MYYIGEMLWPSTLGHMLVLLAFVTAISGALAYIRAASTSQPQNWRSLGRVFFSVHAISVLAIIGLIFYLMIEKRYEYSYVWEHVSDDLQMRYLLSAFWEGQEGSFLLWMFWHVLLGGVVVLLERRWEARVMWGLLIVQAFIGSMLLGIYVWDDFRLGVDPFALLRNTMDAPIFGRPDYLSLIEGQGLNPLLQNYWMTIHPPTLFLGFASVTIPFCFAIGSLQQRDYTSWLKPTVPWALFSVTVLGTGILMGGAWAYEALSFGGYWAWDPVENMSLVPWIVLVAGVHANVISRSTGYSQRITYVLYIIAFLLVLYSTFLTRSGVLGDSSAHAFTQMGLEWQLIAFIVAFAALSVYYLVRNWRSIPTPEQEEKLNSREFWMFVGTLVLLFSAVLITFTTSIPVYNKVLEFSEGIFNTSLEGWKRSMPVDPEAHYNKFQLWIAVFVSVLSGVAQFLRYRAAGWSAHRKRFIRDMATSGLIAALFTALLMIWIDAGAWQYKVLLFSAAFAIACNLVYMAQTVRQTPKLAGSAMAHLGFGVMVVGILASGLNKSVLSSNPFAQRGLLDNMDPARYITLIKERPMYMNGYWVTYTGDTITGNMRSFEIEYARVTETHDTIEKFAVTPNVLFNNSLTKVEATNPSTRHFLSRDIFTYVAALPGEQMDLEEAKRINDTLDFQLHRVAIGDTLRTTEYVLVTQEFVENPRHPDYKPLKGDIALGIRFKAWEPGESNIYESEAMVYLRDGLVYGFPGQINDLNMRLRLNNEVISEYFSDPDRERYTPVGLGIGEIHADDDLSMKLLEIDRNAGHPQYTPETGDIAVNAVVEIDRGGILDTLRPLYLIRSNQIFNLKSQSVRTAVHLRFVQIDPATETFTFEFATGDRASRQLPLEIATNVPRNDLIVIEAIEFPGILLFWLGSICMLAGAGVATWARRNKRKAA